MPAKKNQACNSARRKLVKSIAAGTGAIAGTKMLSEHWVKPVVNSVVLPSHAQTTSREVVLNDVLVEGTYAGEQLAAGPFFSEEGLFGVQFPQQPAQLQITSTEIIYTVGGEEARFPHGMKTIRPQSGIAHRNSGGSGVAERISRMLIPSAHALETVPIQVRIETVVVSPAIVVDREVVIETVDRPATESSVFRLLFRAQATPRCATTTVELPGGETIVIGGLVAETSRSSTLNVPSVPDLVNIPRVGGLFRSADRQIDRKQLCIFITPQLADPS